MTSIADEIRRASARDELHELVRTNKASPRGLCNCFDQTPTHFVFCTLDYGHEPPHVNRLHTWDKPWP